MRARNIVFAVLCLVPLAMFGKGLDETSLKNPPTDSWGMYNGDYTARRFSSLKLINDTNVQNLSLAWTAQISGGTPTSGRGRIGNVVRVGGSPLMVGGVLYLTANDNAWAVDARNGRTLWHFYRESTGDEPVTANKGFGMYGDWLYFITRDNDLVSLDSKTGKQRWILPVSDPKQFYFS